MTHEPAEISVGQVNIVVQNVAASVAFYRRLGVTIEEGKAPEWAPHHATAVMANGFRLEIDSKEFAAQWNPGLRRNAGCGGFVIFVMVPVRNMVDDLFERMRSSGSPVQKAPEDAFWGARYAIVEDPDGNSLGIMSPVDRGRRFAPPPPPRRSDAAELNT